jgi:hypothetical protein
VTPDVDEHFPYFDNSGTASVSAKTTSTGAGATPLEILFRPLKNKAHTDTVVQDRPYHTGDTVLVILEMLFESLVCNNYLLELYW